MRGTDEVFVVSEEETENPSQSFPRDLLEHAETHSLSQPRALEYCPGCTGGGKLRGRNLHRVNWKLPWCIWCVWERGTAMSRR